jgi:hypothetical protein
MDRLIFKRIDFDLAERIIASGPIKRTKPLSNAKEPREAYSYRGARRNAARGSVWKGIRPNGRSPVFFNALNRSQNWPRAKSYQHAREIGPSSEPVR